MGHHPHLYEISAWPWLDRLSRDAGAEITLATVPDRAWDALAAAGMDYVYLMGVWKRSAAGRLIARSDLGLLNEYDRTLPGWSTDDVPGSPYCIQAYEPDARMGGWHGLERTRRALADRGLRLILDFVPNHTGFDHGWMRTHPDYYVEGTLDDYRADPTLYRPIEDASGARVRFVACGRDPFFPPWRDVAQLNYYNPATREAMLATLQSIAARCDGVRCDMAMLVLNDVFERTWEGRVDLLWRRPDAEFWPEATSRVPFTYLAEVYWDREYQLQQQGFDYTYDKRLLDRLDHGDADAVRGHLRADPAYAVRLARFLENHDEPRSAAVFGRRVRAAATIAFTLPGLRFFFDGQFDGTAVRAPVQLGRWPVETGSEVIRDFYARLLTAIDAPLFHDGRWSLLDVRGAGDMTSHDLIAAAWRNGEELAIVTANIAEREAQGLVEIRDLPEGDRFAITDRLSSGAWSWSRQDLLNGLYVRLPAGDAHILAIDAV